MAAWVVLPSVGGQNRGERRGKVGNDARLKVVSSPSTARDHTADGAWDCIDKREREREGAGRSHALPQRCSSERKYVAIGPMTIATVKRASL